MALMITRILTVLFFSDIDIGISSPGMIWVDPATQSATSNGNRAYITETTVNRGVLQFQYTLRRVDPNAPICFSKHYVLVAVSFFDVEKKPLGKALWPIGVDMDFVSLQKTSMGGRVFVPLPASANYFSVDLPGHNVPTGQITLYSDHRQTTSTR